MNKVPTIGQLRSVVKFERNQPLQKGAGKEDFYIEYLTTRGQLIEGTGRMMMDGMAPVLFSKYTLYVRMQDDLDLGKNVRVVINNRIFRIESYKAVDQKKFFYKLELNEDE